MRLGRRPKPDPTERARATLERTEWPPELISALARLREGGHACYLVGGTVRDALLGRAAGEAFDVATDLTPAQVIARFDRVEPIGLIHGTVLVVMETLQLEVTTFRREGAYTDARHPDRVEFTGDVREDLARRDLTVNALAWDPAALELVDPFGGVADLARGMLRAVGDPEARFREDALRPVRAARFAATLEMELDEGTREALGAVADRARQVAVERVRRELELLMAAPRPSVGLRLLRDAGLLELWMPELTRGYGVIQNRWHAWDVWDHSLYSCDAAPADKPAVRWAALLHDIGKPDTKVVRDGEGTFYDHPNVGAALADRLLERLRFPLELRHRIVLLVREHMFDYRSEWSDAAVRRWLRRVGEDAVADLFDLRIADALGNGTRPAYAGAIERMRRHIERVLAESRALRVRDLAVNGEDVMRVLGIAPGPRVGEVLETLLEEVIEHPEANTRDHLSDRLEAMRSDASGTVREA